jgi:CrcB protein
MNIYGILLVGIGGFFGSIARYMTVQMIDGRINSVFPYGTLAVNVIGCFILGLISGMFYQQLSKDNLRLLLATGFCGGFTTFSAFALENFNLVNEKLAVTSVLYAILSMVLGFAAVAAGVVIGRLLTAAR